MKRKTDSLLNQWVKKQGSNQRKIAFDLGILKGTLTSWLYQGFVSHLKIDEIAEKTGIDKDKLLSEYNKRKNLTKS